MQWLESWVEETSVKSQCSIENWMNLLFVKMTQTIADKSTELNCIQKISKQTNSIYVIKIGCLVLIYHESEIRGPKTLQTEHWTLDEESRIIKNHFNDVILLHFGILTTNHHYYIRWCVELKHSVLKRERWRRKKVEFYQNSLNPIPLKVNARFIFR